MDKLDHKLMELITLEIRAEFVRSVEVHKFAFFNSYHEGYAVILEEMDELWEEVKKYPKQNNNNLRKEAVQVGAMALRFVYDLMSREK